MNNYTKITISKTPKDPFVGDIIICTSGINSGVARRICKVETSRINFKKLSIWKLLFFHPKTFMRMLKVKDTITVDPPFPTQLNAGDSFIIYK